MDSTTTPGEGETFKGSVHLLLFGLSVMCAGYNALAWSQRKERHLSINTAVYTGLAIYEFAQIREHFEDNV